MLEFSLASLWGIFCGGIRRVKFAKYLKSKRYKVNFEEREGALGHSSLTAIGKGLRRDMDRGVL